MSANRNYNVDSLKLLCAIFVVLIHSQFVFKDVVIPLLRVAVPIFFMISGYFMYGPNIAERIKRAIRRMLNIFIWSNLIYVAAKELLAIYHHDVFIPSKAELLNFLFLNENPFGWHLWYIGAYLYVLIIVYFINRFNKWKYLFYVAPILIVALLLMSYFDIERIYYRNFLFMGLPFFSIGAFLRKRHISCNVNWYTISFLFLLGMFSIVEKYITGLNQELFLSSLILSIGILLCVVSEKKQKNNVISKLGGQYSLDIYIFHGLFILYFFPTINGHCGSSWNRIYNSISPIFIVGITFVFVFLYEKIKLILVKHCYGAKEIF